MRYSYHIGILRMSYWGLIPLIIYAHCWYSFCVLCGVRPCILCDISRYNRQRNLVSIWIPDYFSIVFKCLSNFRVCLAKSNPSDCCDLANNWGIFIHNYFHFEMFIQFTKIYFLPYPWVSGAIRFVLFSWSILPYYVFFIFIPVTKPHFRSMLSANHSLSVPSVLGGIQLSALMEGTTKAMAKQHGSN